MKASVALTGTSCIAILLAGCMTTTWSACDQNKADFKWQSGDPRCPLVVSTKGIGLVVGHGRVTLGWFDEKLVKLDDVADCRVVLFVEKPGQITTIVEILRTTGKDLTNICIASN